MKLELDKKLLERIAKSTDKEWLSFTQENYFLDAKISWMCGAVADDDSWIKDYHEELAYGNACNDRLNELRLAEKEGDNETK